MSFWLRHLQQQDEIRPLKCVRDNDTRWLSQLSMIRRALKLRKYLDRVLFEFGWEWKEQNTTSRGTLKSGKKLPRMVLDEGKLTENDWIALERLEKILQHYETVVKTLEGN